MTRTFFLLFTCCLLAAAAKSQDTPLPTTVVAAPTILDIEDSNYIFHRVEIEAAFPGGLEAWKQYLMKNLRGAEPAKNGAPNGRFTVVIRFIVSKDATISAIQPETKHGYGLEEEVMRIIKKGPKWKPAIQGGRKVNAYRRQPVTVVVGGSLKSYAITATVFPLSNSF